MVVIPLSRQNVSLDAPISSDYPALLVFLPFELNTSISKVLLMFTPFGEGLSEGSMVVFNIPKKQLIR